MLQDMKGICYIEVLTYVGSAAAQLHCILLGAAAVAAVNHQHIQRDCCMCLKVDYIYLHTRLSAWQAADSIVSCIMLSYMCACCCVQV
jgi:hypothetical protein